MSPTRPQEIFQTPCTSITTQARPPSSNVQATLPPRQPKPQTRITCSRIPPQATFSTSTVQGNPRPIIPQCKLPSPRQQRRNIRLRPWYRSSCGIRYREGRFSGCIYLAQELRTGAAEDLQIWPQRPHAPSYHGGFEGFVDDSSPPSSEQPGVASLFLFLRTSTSTRFPASACRNGSPASVPNVVVC